MADSSAQKVADLEVVTIYEISKLLGSSLDFPRTVREVLHVLLNYLHMHHGMVSLVQDSGKLHVVGASGLPDGDCPRFDIELNHAAVAKVLRTGMPIVVPDITEDPLFADEGAGGRDMSSAAGTAFIGVPIRGGMNAIGVLSVDRRPGTDRPISFDRDVRILSLVANLIGQTYKLHQTVAADRQELIEQTHKLQKRLQGDYDIENVIGKSRRMKEVFSDVHQAAPGNATILLRGESGTGKEAIAHAVHYLSGRSKGPFVKVNCAALSETLLESELFGHEKGAFTGAMTERAGRFELANGGTLFLDEIGDVSPAFQAKMLRVLQEKEFERVGGNRTIKADFRLVAATNRNLEEMVAEGDFRADLYFRINVVTIFLPALRERKEDIPLLVDFFLDRFNRENGRKLTLAPEAMDVMRHCNWPGNVRELENCIERTATMTRGSLIRDSDMRCQRNQCFSSVLLETSGKRACAPSGHMGRSPEPRERVNGSERVNGGERTNGAERLNGNDRMNGAERANGSERMNGAERAFAQSEPEPMEFVDEEYVADLGEEVVPRHNYLSERERLVAAMEKCGWVQAKAARLLNLTPRQIGYALKKYNIEVKQL